MINTILFNRLLTVELRNGVGLDLEFVDSRPVWTYNAEEGLTDAMPFEGTIILLPFIVISYGRVYSEADNNV